MSEQMQKLIQDLAILFAKPIATYHPSLGLVYPTMHKKLAAELTEQAITRTLKAVADGMPLHPWEIERIDVDAYVGELLDWIEDLPRHTELIALSPTEEEK